MPGQHKSNKAYYGEFKLIDVMRAVKKIRLHKGIEPEELVKNIGIAPSTLLQFEAGKLRLADKHILPLAQELHFNNIANMIAAADSIEEPRRAKVSGPSADELFTKLGTSSQEVADIMGISPRKLPDPVIEPETGYKPRTSWVKVVAHSKKTGLEK